MSDTINPSGTPQTQPDAPQTAQIPPAPAAAPVPPAAGAAVPPAGSAPIPPAGQVPPFQAAPPQQPVQNIPGMPLFNLTGGMKFGWAAAGFLLGPVAILLAWLTNAHNFPEAKSAAVKFSLFGFLAQFLVWILVIGMFGCAACTAATSLPSYYYY
ncbi:MAG: spore coat protein SP96 [Slackia sp.]|nr:spore coat protein SP96 [Slackia sp.]